MNNWRILVAVSTICLQSNAVFAQTSNTEVLNNQTVVSLVGAGLGSESVIAKIKASAGSYDTSINALILLKQSNVPDAVIAAMVDRSNSPVLANATTDNSSPNPLAAHSPGIYIFEPAGAGRMHRIDATVSNQTKSSGLLGYALTSGIASMKMKSVVPNPFARVRTTERRPTFYFYLNPKGVMAEVSQFGSPLNAVAGSPNEFSLLRLDQKKDRREVAVGSINAFSGIKTGVGDKARIAFTYEDVAPGVFKVTPSAAILPGEYGFILSMTSTGGAGARIFDFSVK